jgi:adenylyltransferase/sulfurtransferase
VDKGARIEIRTDADADRFSRFELITWWDQRRLHGAKVLVIGAGALGNEIVKNAALLGLGNLLVVDMDRIELSNLSRSVLFRESDNGRPKAEVACAGARAIYPQVAAHAFVGNAIHDLGWGVYFWADVILGGLDNREARVAINQGAAFAGKPWIDGAIEVLSGVARVFNPAEGACYECTMSDVDWKILQHRRSCALLSRDEMAQGKVPTTPTTASIIAALQVQEAVKLLHGLPTLSGQGIRLDGLAGEVYRVEYPRKPDCMGHERCGRLEPLGAGVADVKVGQLLARARAEVGPEAVIRLSRDVIARLICPACGRSDERFAALGKVTEAEAKCPQCGQPRAPEMLMTVGLDGALDDRTFAEIGVPPFDVVTAEAGDRAVSYLFDGDAAAVLGGLAR